jgi:hypothetical protein
MDSALEGSGHTFEITFRTESNCLVADVAGWIDGIDALISMFRRIGAELVRTHCARLLVLDHTRGVVPSEDEMKRLMIAFEGHGFSEVRVAYVDTRGTAVSRMEVGEILGREYGYECRVFDNEQLGRIWLNYFD